VGSKAGVDTMEKIDVARTGNRTPAVKPVTIPSYPSSDTSVLTNYTVSRPRRQPRPWEQQRRQSDARQVTAFAAAAATPVHVR
jgi:hypothetical protein